MAATVHIVDDDRSFRTAIGRLLEASGFEVADYESGSDLLGSQIGDGPGCILLDLQMPGLDGLQLQTQLAIKVPLLPIVFLTGHGSIESSVKAIKGGAEDFLEKPVAAATLLAAIDRALLRYETARAERERMVELRTHVEALTPREAQVFHLIVRGKRNKQIAHELGMAERTVKAHRQSIMEKLAVRSLAEAVSIAERLGLLAAGDDMPAR
jgi:FixJ family two-component response regulator